MFLGRIYVLVAKNICNKVNITCFLIQGRTVGAAELVRCDLFGGRDLLGIFLDKILNRLDTDTAALGRVEESVFMAFQRNDILADFQITFQSFFYLRSEIYNHFISTFSGDLYSVILKIHIFNIKSHTFRNSDTGSEKQSHDRQIAFFVFLIVDTFLTGKLVATMFYIIKQESNLIGIKPDDAFVMDLWHIDKYGRICLDHFPSVIICIKTPKGRDLSFEPTFAVCFGFVTSLVDLEIFLIFLKIQSLDLIQDINCKIRHFVILKCRIFIKKKLKENPDIVGIGNPGLGRSRRIDRTKIIPAKRRQR